MRFNAFLCFQQGLTEARSRCPRTNHYPKKCTGNALTTF
ncbi:hypothetical protein SbBS512_C0006 (plasmid) [Shigella boydii CDC 3083-94]|uniref:Uncharacterized protein n=1 Tax=Shigella boydii serotype 18 (strain CDC 3083-94 / BS512) TaxID=344609 RepID=B2TSK2_SHIB3|nr:hypothetical protein SbBS512_C0006 [Shigella boydii CDC 3083-94]EGW97866.1 hypothetical protein ECG581_4947 [Escherichia coli G58-1]EIQ78968.1 hypothetical protein SF123566_9627 [Shigella flexneri 1235-66]ENA23587.1 hypothetical protein ECBCE007MS11_5509 [Escherichia coli BCE007_MS-11]ENA87087.1 hypothetical protein EC2741950_5180 [Escherichia coli 2741950]